MWYVLYCTNNMYVRKYGDIVFLSCCYMTYMCQFVIFSTYRSINKGHACVSS